MGSPEDGSSTPSRSTPAKKAKRTRKKKPAKKAKAAKGRASKRTPNRKTSENMGRVKGRGRGRAKTSKQAVETAQRYAQVLELRKQGKSLQAIADELGYAGPSGVHQALTRAIEQTVSEPAEDVRALEVMRLDSLFMRAWKQIEKGYPLAGQNGIGAFVLRLMDRRAKLLGLDAPEKVEASVKSAGPEYSRMDGKQIEAAMLDLWRKMPADLRAACIQEGSQDGVE